MVASEGSARPVVVIVGAAVAGSEAAALCAERGLTAIVLEQRDRPFGKIEDGLPRWHEKLRASEYEQITENLSHPGVFFVPRTELGVDVRLDELLHDWGVSAVLLASGAWRDRPLFDGADAFIGRGLVYQNALVHAYNHYPERDYVGPGVPAIDGALVVGGGLASIDVVKLLSLESAKRLLAANGVHTSTVALEREGVASALSRAGVEEDAFGNEPDARVRAPTLVYRRTVGEMPLVSLPDGATPEQVARTQQVRKKLLDKVVDKFRVGVRASLAVEGPLVAEDRLVGLRLRRTETRDGRLVLGEPVTIQAPLIVSSIGSIPSPIAGVPMRGELVDFADWTTGAVRGLPGVFGLGNVLTGKGNIKESRRNAVDVAERLIEQYLVGTFQSDFPLPGRETARERAEPAIAHASQRPLSALDRAAILARVHRHWARVGFDGDLTGWLADHKVIGEE